MKKKMAFFLLVYLCFPVFMSVKAECNQQETIRISKLMSNVNSSYTFNEEDQSFTIRFTNLVDDLYLYDENYFEAYYPENGEVILYDALPSYSYEFTVRSTKCEDTRVNRYVTLPFYNPLYKEEICQGVTGLSLCEKWASTPDLTEEEFVAEVTAYKNRKAGQEQEKEEVDGLFDIIINFFVKYYFIVIPVVIVLCVVGIVLKVKLNKKNKLF